METEDKISKFYNTITSKSALEKQWKMLNMFECKFIQNAVYLVIGTIVPKLWVWIYFHNLSGK